MSGCGKKLLLTLFLALTLCACKQPKADTSQPIAASATEAADVISIEDNMYQEDEDEGHRAVIIQGEQEPDQGIDGNIDESSDTRTTKV